MRTIVRKAELTRGERLLIERRYASENTQKGYADHFGVSLYRYRQWENDETPGPRVSLSRGAFDTVGGSRRLADYIQCFILRRRRGWKRSHLAKLMGISEYWLGLMEHGRCDADELVEFWEGECL